MTEITYTTSLSVVDWVELKATLQADNFDNGRTPVQYQRSAENSFLNIFAWAEAKIIGNLRVLSDGVGNAYIVDVWTLSAYRRQGVATQMLQLALGKLEGQHVYLFTGEAESLYRKLGFEPQGVGLGKVVGQWLVNK